MITKRAAVLASASCALLIAAVPPAFAQSHQQGTAIEPVAPPLACRSVIEDERLRVVVAALDQLRAADPQVWNGYPAGAVYAFLLRGSDQSPSSSDICWAMPGSRA